LVSGENAAKARRLTGMNAWAKALCEPEFREILQEAHQLLWQKPLSDCFQS
jgi:hypothetical protein